MNSSTLIPNLLGQVNKIAFSWYDYILFSTMLGLSALIGIYFGCFGSKQSTANEYLMGGKTMKVFPISMSLVASHVSGITLLAVPADVYRFGASYWLVVLSIPIVGALTNYIFLPVFFRLQITSTYEYLGRRFDSKTRTYASFLFTLSMFLYLPIVIYLPALAFSAATGINVHLVTPIVCGVCIFYTTIGGLKAVVWTDTLQFTITIGAVVTVFILGVKSVGGIQEIWTKATIGRRLDIFDFDFDPTKRDSFWITFVGMTVGWTALTSFNQTCVQKFLSLQTLYDAKLSVIYFFIGIGIISSFSIFTGLIMYAKYANCDPFTTKQVTRDDQLLPYYVMDVARNIPGLPGLFIAGVFCAALSTLSASLNCLAGTIYEDFVVKNLHKDISEKTSSNILKIIVLIIGVICTALVFIIEHMGGILPLAISLGSVTQGPLLGMFFLGFLFPKATKKGTFYGSIVGLLFAGWIVVMAQYYKSLGFIKYEAKPTSIDGCIFDTLATFSGVWRNTTSISAIYTTELPIENIKSKPFFLFRISYYYYNTLGATMTMVVALIISYFDKSDPPVHRDLISPIVHSFLPKENDKADMDYIEYCDIKTAINLVTTSNSKKEHHKSKDVI